MTLPKDFAEMMLQTIILSPQSAVDKYGKQTFGTGVSYKCRLMTSQRITRDAQGREIIEAGRAIIYGVLAATPSPHDRIQLPDGSTPKVVSVSKVQDEDGDHHSVIGYGQ